MATASTLAPAALIFVLAALASGPAKAQAPIFPPDAPPVAQAPVLVEAPPAQVPLDRQPRGAVRDSAPQQEWSSDEDMRVSVGRHRRAAGWLIGMSVPGGFVSLAGVAVLGDLFIDGPAGTHGEIGGALGVAAGVTATGVMIGYGVKNLKQARAIDKRLSVTGNATKDSAHVGVTFAF